LIVGALAPWLGNAIYISGLSPFYRLDLTPFAFTLASLTIGWAIFRHELLNLLPVAYSAVIKNMRDGLIVLDESERIVEVNPVAERITGIPASAAVGQPAKLVLSGVVDLMPLLESEASRATVAIPDDQGERTYDVIASDIPRPKGQRLKSVLPLGKGELEGVGSTPPNFPGTSDALSKGQVK
jgi:PAS domain-containing protein